MSSFFGAQPDPVGDRGLSLGCWPVASVVSGWQKVACSLLIGIPLAVSCLSSGAYAGPIDYTPFYTATSSGSTATALFAGRDLYTQLAVNADGLEPFYRAGTMLISARGAADTIVQLYADPNGSNATCSTNSLWRTLSTTSQIDRAFASDEQGTFLRDYLRLYVDYQLQRILTAANAAPLESGARAAKTVDFLVVLLAMLDTEGTASQPAVSQTVAWISTHGQSRQAIAQSLTHAKPQIACAVSRERLAQAPADTEVRRELMDLVVELCKAGHIQEALTLCDQARDITQDPAYGSVLVLQQAIIAARDQKDPVRAISLCDQVAAASGEKATVQLARHLGAVYCLTRGDYAEAIRRAEALAKDPETTLSYRLKASNVAATAFTRQDKPQEAVNLLTALLDELTEPEPVEAAETRQLLCEALLQMRHIDEAIGQCRVLAARHPNHAVAPLAKRAIQQLTAKDDVVGKDKP